MKTEFTKDQYKSGYPDGIENHWWHLARNKILANIINCLVGPDAVVLDVGCGRGILVKSFRNLGIDCTGVDISKPIPVASAEKYIHTGIDVLDLPLSERKQYNTILFLDVIEHTTAPVSFIQNILNGLPNAEKVIITVPARKELWTNQDEYYGHHRRYSTEMLIDLAKGLDVNRLHESYFFHLLYPLLWIVANLKKKRNPRISNPNLFLKFVHKIISYVMIMDYYLIPGRVFGTSALVVLSLNK